MNNIRIFRYTTQRPQYWTGVDAHDFQDGQIEIDWPWIDTVIDNCGGDAMEAHYVIISIAEEARLNGDLEDCAWLASMAMACANYA